MRSTKNVDSAILMEDPVYRAKRKTEMWLKEQGAYARKVLTKKNRVPAAEIEHLVAPYVAEMLGERARRVVARRHIVAMQAITKAREMKKRAKKAEDECDGSKEEKERAFDLWLKGRRAYSQAFDKCKLAEADECGVMGLDEGLGEDEGPVPETFTRSIPAMVCFNKLSVELEMGGIMGGKTFKPKDYDVELKPIPKHRVAELDKNPVVAVLKPCGNGAEDELLLVQEDVDGLELKEM